MEISILVIIKGSTVGSNDSRTVVLHRTCKISFEVSSFCLDSLIRIIVIIVG